MFYPGLADHPHHDLAAARMDAFGGMVSFELDATLEEACEVVTETHVFTLAESLGSGESPLELPAAMTHAAVPREQREAAGLTDGMVGASVGLEHVEDQKADLQGAFKAAGTA